MTLSPICSICCEQFTSSSIVQGTNCGHLFHNDCIERWRNRKSSCPECRQTTSFLTRIYFNCNNSQDTSEATAMMSSTPQEVEDLILKLSLEEAKRKAAEERTHESLQKQYESVKMAKKKQDEHEKLLLSFKLQLEKEQRRRIAAEESEKNFRKQIEDLKKTSQRRDKIDLVTDCQRRKSTLKSKPHLQPCKREIEIFDLETETQGNEETFENTIRIRSDSCSRHSNHSHCSSRMMHSCQGIRSPNGLRPFEVEVREKNLVLHYRF